ncbi:MAG: DUF4143 domain-containing protein [Phycisphaerae bacterium]|nr:DUF4143 domain-containing protein [Saprospiraceae bacterium]
MRRREDRAGRNQIAGASWEGYVLQQIIANLPSSILPYFYRTKDGSEIDLVLVRGNKPVLAVEIKMSASPSLSKGNRLALSDLGNPPAAIVLPHNVDYPLEEQVRVCGLEHLSKYMDGGL